MSVVLESRPSSFTAVRLPFSFEQVTTISYAKEKTNNHYELQMLCLRKVSIHVG